MNRFIKVRIYRKAMKKCPKASDLKVGVVGYGGAFNMGRVHLREMQSAGMTPCAVVELDPQRLQVAEQDFPGIQKYTTVDELLAKSDVDLVTIITPHNSHAPLALKCLRAGRHVISEKPMAITTKECDAMIAAAKKKKLLLSAYHNRHWDGGIMRAVEEIKMSGGVTRTEKGKNPKAEGHRYYENIAAHLTRGEKLVITPEWSRRPIHAIDLAVQSAKRGKALPAKYG